MSLHDTIPVLLLFAFCMFIIFLPSRKKTENDKRVKAQDLRVGDIIHCCYRDPDQGERYRISEVHSGGTICLFGPLRMEYLSVKILNRIGFKLLSKGSPRPLDFNTLSKASLARVPSFGHTVEGWSETDWACALAGEAGELCNLIKKRRRGDSIPVEEVGKELADTILYAVLLSAKLNINLGEAVRSKFNEVSDRINYPGKL